MADAFKFSLAACFVLLCVAAPTLSGRMAADCRRASAERATIQIGPTLQSP
jgi:hypothetical protein